MTKGKVIRASDCPYCGKTLHTDISCKCKCPHPTEHEVPICYMCIADEIKASKERRVAQTNDRISTMTLDNHFKMKESLNDRGSFIQQTWKTEKKTRSTDTL